MARRDTRPRHQRDPAVPYRLGLGRREQSSHSFTEMLLDELEPEALLALERKQCQLF